MLKIKLARFGKKDQPHYRFIINEARSKRDGGYVAKIGHYAPTQTPKILEINIEEYKAWIAKGAQPTPTVENLVKRYQSGQPFPAKKARPSKKSQAKAAAAAEAKAAPKKDPVAEVTPAEVETAPAETAEETTKSESEEVEAETKTVPEAPAQE